MTVILPQLKGCRENPTVLSSTLLGHNSFQSQSQSGETSVINLAEMRLKAKSSHRFGCHEENITSVLFLQRPLEKNRHLGDLQESLSLEGRSLEGIMYTSVHSKQSEDQISLLAYIIHT